MSERISWRKAALFAVFGAALASACVVGSDDGDGVDDDDGGGANRAGSSGKGGSGTSGGGTGGGATGGSAAGGDTGTAGEDGTGGEPGPDTTPTCDEPEAGGAGGQGTITGTPQPAEACLAVNDQNKCQVCIEELCCEAYNNCNAYEPYNVCGWGGPEDWPANGGEFLCYLDCMSRNYDDPDVDGADPTATTDVIDSTLENLCLAECATPSCSSIRGDETEDMAACIRDVCQEDCID